MLPILLKIGPLTINSYGALIAIGFLATMIYMARKSPQFNLRVDQTLDLTFWTFIFGMLGGRLLFVITQWQTYIKAPLKIFALWEGGFVFYGGLLGLFVGYLYSKRRKIPVLTAFLLERVMISSFRTS